MWVHEPAGHFPQLAVQISVMLPCSLGFFSHSPLWAQLMHASVVSTHSGVNGAVVYPRDILPSIWVSLRPALWCVEASCSERSSMESAPSSSSAKDLPPAAVATASSSSMAAAKASYHRPSQRDAVARQKFSCLFSGLATPLLKRRCIRASLWYRRRPRTCEDIWKELQRIAQIFILCRGGNHSDVRWPLRLRK